MSATIRGSRKYIEKHDRKLYYKQAVDEMFVILMRSLYERAIRTETMRGEGFSDLIREKAQKVTYLVGVVMRFNNKKCSTKGNKTIQTGFKNTLCSSKGKYKL